MAKSGDIRAGGAFIELSADDVEMRRALDSAQTHLQAFGQRAKTILVQAVAIGGFAAVGRSALKAASNLEIAQRRFSTAFQSTGAATQSWVRQVSDAFGYGQGTLMDFMATFQQTLTPMGFIERDAAQMSQTFTRLGMDLAARFGRPAEEAISALQRTMMGSTRALRYFGISLDETTIRQELMALGIADATSLLTQQQRAYGALSLVLKRTADYQGAAATEANTWAQTTMRLREMWTDVLETIGAPLGQVLTPVLNAMTGILRQVRDFLERHPAFIRGLARIASIITGAILTVSQGLTAISVAIGSMLLTGSRNAEQAITYVGNRISTGFGDALAGIYNRWGAVTEMMRDMAVNLAMAAYHSAMAYVYDFADGFKSTLKDAYTETFDGMYAKARETIEAISALSTFLRDVFGPPRFKPYHLLPGNVYSRDKPSPGPGMGEPFGPPVPSAAEQHRADAAARMAAFRAGLSDAASRFLGGGGGGEGAPPEGYRLPQLDLPGAPVFEAPTLPAGGVMGFIGARRIGEMMGGNARGIDGQQLDVQRQMLHVLESIRDSDQGAVYA